KKSRLEGFVLRPITFIPTFDKNMNKICGGFQIHITNKASFKPWRVGQLMLRELYHFLDGNFKWRTPPFEYNYTKLPIDIINGSHKLRHWVENNESIEMLDSFENLEDYKLHLEEIKMY
ncbi:MAG: hypothetical protein ACI85B_002179, partial [Flavobacteriaceae bacterium]